MLRIRARWSAGRGAEAFRIPRSGRQIPAHAGPDELRAQVAASEASTVLIQGESGTGKDLVAKAIHYDSVRADKPFCPRSIVRQFRNPDGKLNCSGTSAGRLPTPRRRRKASLKWPMAGTCSSTKSVNCQLTCRRNFCGFWKTKRSGALADQGHRVDVRVIAASNRDLEQGVREGTFRQDLFYRLSIIPIFILLCGTGRKTFFRSWISSSNVTTSGFERASGHHAGGSQPAAGL